MTSSQCLALLVLFGSCLVSAERTTYKYCGAGKNECGKNSLCLPFLTTGRSRCTCIKDYEVNEESNGCKPIKEKGASKEDPKEKEALLSKLKEKFGASTTTTSAPKRILVRPSSSIRLSGSASEDSAEQAPLFGFKNCKNPESTECGKNALCYRIGNHHECFCTKEYEEINGRCIEIPEESITVELVTEEPLSYYCPSFSRTCDTCRGKSNCPKNAKLFDSMKSCEKECMDKEPPVSWFCGPRGCSDCNFDKFECPMDVGLWDNENECNTKCRRKG